MTAMANCAPNLAHAQIGAASTSTAETTEMEKLATTTNASPSAPRMMNVAVAGKSATPTKATASIRINEAFSKPTSVGKVYFQNFYQACV